MIKIEDNVITIIKGDTAIINVSIEDYILTTPDIVLFTVKESIEDNVYVLQKIIRYYDSTGVARIELTSDDTDLDPGTYIYDIEVRFDDGRVDTIIQPTKFKVKGGVTD